MNDSFAPLLASLKAHAPLIHAITNPISIHQCANAILAVGARPIMAEHPREVAEITETAGALLLNLGNITDVRMESMEISAQTACRCGIPFVLDAVGVGCSSLRREYAHGLLQRFSPAVFKFVDTLALTGEAMKLPSSWRLVDSFALYVRNIDYFWPWSKWWEFHGGR